ncbi:teichoic acid D-Ala incorporation-associated protein DltX, partial [Klebsiella pneumoniae]|nr:teichoic acid D-Ala incorporation-associated protein DltX [Klebsiella pneumoniae]
MIPTKSYYFIKRGKDMERLK